MTKHFEFQGLGIAPNLLVRLSKLKFTEPTPIQAQAIPVAIQDKDLVGIAQTGTGKTLAFGIPMMQRLAAVKGRGLIVLPTRELALQVDEALRQVGSAFGLRTAVLIGGASMQLQLQALKRNPHIIVGTPGRLNDHLEQKTFDPRLIKIVVLDEADRMLDMGFAPQIKRVLRDVPRERQTMLFSATMPPQIMQLAAAYMQLPIRIEVAPPGTTAERVTQEFFVVPKDQKVSLVAQLLQQYRGSILIFTRTKHGAKKLARTIRLLEVPAAEIHSNRSLNQRREALDGFRAGKYRVLVATDIAARGIDVSGIELVLNYDLPTQAEDYVHRIGRTARAGSAGHAISFATPDQRGEMRDIEHLVKQRLTVSPLPKLTPVDLPKPDERELRYERDEARRPQSRPRFSGGNRGSRPGGGQRSGGARYSSRPRR